jgi:hypothetical protein
VSTSFSIVDGLVSFVTSTGEADFSAIGWEKMTTKAPTPIFHRKVFLHCKQYDPFQDLYQSLEVRNRHI